MSNKIHKFANSQIHKFTNSQIIRQYFLICLCLLVLFSGCNQEVEPFRGQESVQLKTAKEWFLIQQKNQTELGKALNKKPNPLGQQTPIWNEAFSHNHTKGILFEIPLQYDGKLTDIRFDSHRNDASLDKSKPVSVSRLLILQTPNGKHFPAIMRIVGDNDYLKKNQANLHKNTYLNMQKDFSGKVMYYSLQEELVFIEDYKNGKVKERFVGEGLSKRTSKEKSVNCYTYTTYVTYQICAGPGNTGCGDIGVDIISHTVCFYTPSSNYEESDAPIDIYGEGGGGGDVYEYFVPLPITLESSFQNNPKASIPWFVSHEPLNFGS